MKITIFNFYMRKYLVNGK